MTDPVYSVVEPCAGGEPDAWCPYCDRARGHNRHGLMATCGTNECFRAAMRASAAISRPPLWGVQEIDFQNGFDSQNIRFAADWSRLQCR